MGNLLALLSFLMPLVALRTIADFRPTLFNSLPNGYFPVSLANFTANGNVLSAFSDLNNDKFTDFVTLDDARTSLQIYLYNEALGSFILDSMCHPLQCRALGLAFIDSAFAKQ